MPGDDVVREPTLVSTRAIFVDAPPERVWPWLVQMGQDRGGFYSYDRLERLLGLGIRNAEVIVPEWQSLAVGDRVRLAPATWSDEAAFTVSEIDEPHHLVMVAGDPSSVAADGSRRDGASWSFLLDPTEGGGTHLLVRMRARFGLPAPVESLFVHVLGPAHFLMERRQLIGIRRRAMAV